MPASIEAITQDLRYSARGVRKTRWIVAAGQRLTMFLAIFLNHRKNNK
jgi:hypothetical protein